MTIKVKIKKLIDQAEIPKKASEGAAAFDLKAIDYYYNSSHNFHEYGTGLSLELPEGYEAQIRPRSSISKTSFMLCNPPGTIDSDYRGEIKIRFKHIDDRELFYDVGDRVAQLIIQKIPKVEFQEVGELSETIRGTGGFGSTNK